MTINRMLKFALPAMLLAVSAPAYADGEAGTTEPNEPTGPAEVTLSNGTSMPWEQFVSDLQTPPTKVEGVTLPEDAQVVKDAATASQNLETKKAAVGPLEKDSITKEAELSTAIRNKEDYVTENVTPLETAYNTLVNTTLPGKKSDLTGLINQRNTLTAQLQSAQANLQSLQAALASYTAQLAQVNEEIAANTETTETTDTQTAQWLKDILIAAQNFYSEYKSKTNTTEIYYLYEVAPAEDPWSDPSYNLTISFITPANVSDWTGPVDQAGLRTLFSTIYEKDKITQFSNLYVYLGPNYAAQEQSDTRKVGSDIGFNNVAEDVKEAVALASRDNRFQTTTTTTETTYKDEELQKQLEARKKALNQSISDTNTAIATAQATVTNLNNQLNGVPASEGQEAVKGVNEQITDLEDEISVLEKTTIPNAKTAWENAQKTADDTYDPLIKAAQTNVDNANKAVADARAAVTAAEQQLAAALTAYNEALAAAQKDALDALLAAYNDVTLNADINATEAVTKDYAGTIFGNNHIINVDIAGGTQSTLFKSYSGKLTNAAINGPFALSVLEAKFGDVVRWNGSNGVYSNESGVSTNYTGTDAFGKLGYALREDANFGVNFETGKIVAQNKDLLVYNITVNYFNGDEANTQYYVQNINNTLIAYNQATVEIPTNRFAKSEDEFDFPNVYYGPNNYCSEVVIVDKLEDGSEVNFYSPVDITTRSIKLNRRLTKGYNTVCLPFATTYELLNNANILAICNYEKEDANRFWFTKVAEGLKANTPLLVVTSDEANFESLENLSTTVTIAKTDKTQISKGSIGEEGSMSFGTFKRTAAGEFLGQSNMSCIYGLNKDGQFQRATANTDLTAKQAHFPAFRMVLASNSTFANSSAMRAPGEGNDIKGIGILDENGSDITDRIVTGINNVTVDNNAASSLEVVPGQGMITINSEADYGDVAIYSIDGKVAAIANVMAGTTTVNLQHGVYIVLGKKVMVK